MADQLIFDSRYFIGIEQVDLEHQKLFELAENIYDILSVDVFLPMNQIKPAIIELVNYTKIHFVNEESLMEANGYSDLEQHREQHAYLIVRINDFARSVVLGEQLTPVDAYEFLCSWLCDHIQTSDRAFGEFMLSMQE